MREFVVRFFAFDRVCVFVSSTAHIVCTCLLPAACQTDPGSLLCRPCRTHRRAGCCCCLRFMRLSGCLIGVYPLPFASAGTLQLQVPAARAIATMPVRAFVSNNLFSTGTVRAGESPVSRVSRNTSHLAIAKELGWYATACCSSPKRELISKFVVLL